MDIPIEYLWFDNSINPYFQKKYSWLSGLPSKIECIANFGYCGSCEPFALVWILDSKEVMVIEIEQDSIDGLCENVDFVNHKFPKILEGRAINYICADMTQDMTGLPEGYFDLAYCEDVLCHLHRRGNPYAVEPGIMQMIRVVKPNGFIIAVEPQYGVDYEKNRLGIATHPLNDPKNMSNLFPSKGLRKLELPGCPPYSYCYQKTDEHIL